MTTEPLTVADDGAGWVPQSCTLPTAEQPLRAAEFDNLFTTSLRGMDRLASTRLQLVLDTAAEATARDLAARETGCCSFFAFDFAPGPAGRLLMEVTVPPAYVDVLDALTVRAGTAAGLSA